MTPAPLAVTQISTFFTMILRLGQLHGYSDVKFVWQIANNDELGLLSPVVGESADTCATIETADAWFVSPFLFLFLWPFDSSGLGIGLVEGVIMGGWLAEWTKVVNLNDAVWFLRTW